MCTVNHSGEVVFDKLKGSCVRLGRAVMGPDICLVPEIVVQCYVLICLPAWVFVERNETKRINEFSGTSASLCCGNQQFQDEFGDIK